MSSNPYRPQLPADTLWEERAELVGTFLGNITFGSSFIIYLLTLTAILRKPAKASKEWFHIFFASALFVLGLLYVAFDNDMQVNDFIDDRDFPGGPEAYESAHYSDALTVIPNVFFVVTEWIADAFLIYRCVIIFRLRPIFITLPILTYLGCIATGILVLFQASRPGATLWTKVSIDFGLPYFSLSAALNVTVTLLITVRLLLFRRSTVQALGKEHASSLPYVSIAAVLIESSMLYGTMSLLFIGTYGAKSHASLLFLPILAGIQIISPTLIVYRIARMKAWDSSTSSKPYLTTMMFENRQDRAAPVSSDEEQVMSYSGGGLVNEVHLSSASVSVGSKR